MSIAPLEAPPANQGRPAVDPRDARLREATTGPDAGRSHRVAPIVPHRALGDSGIEVFPFALRLDGDAPRRGDTAELRMLDRFGGDGGTMLDLSGGRAQLVAGAWLRRSPVRDRMVLATTVSTAPPGAGAQAGSAGPQLVGATIRRTIDAALRRLGTDRVDLVHLHLDDGLEAFDETLLALDGLVRSGKVRAFGGSGVTVQRMVEARVASGQLSLTRMASLRHPYSLHQRLGFERQAAVVAGRLGLGVLPLVRFGPVSGSRREARRSVRITKALQHVAAELSTDARSVAMAWLLTKPGIVAPVAAARSERDIAELVRGATLQLSRSQLTELDRVSDRSGPPAGGLKG